MILSAVFNALSFIHFNSYASHIQTEKGPIQGIMLGTLVLESQEFVGSYVCCPADENLNILQPNKVLRI